MATLTIKNPERISGIIFDEAEYLKDPDNLVGIVKDRILDKFTI